MTNMKLISAATVGITIALSAGAFAQDKQHDVATFVSGGATGTWFPTATAISEMVNKAYDGQPVSAIPGKGAENSHLPFRKRERVMQDFRSPVGL